MALARNGFLWLELWLLLQLSCWRTESTSEYLIVAIEQFKYCITIIMLLPCTRIFGVCLVLKLRYNYNNYTDT